MRLLQDAQYLACSNAVTTPPLPTKPYLDYTGEGYTFLTRDPAAEMSLTVETLSQLMADGGFWATAETLAGQVLTSRFIGTESNLNNTIANRLNTYVSNANTYVFGTQPEESTAYAQYLAGMSASFGGGHTSVETFGQVATADKKLTLYDSALKSAISASATSFQATSAMPLVVPLESQLVSDACASAVEAHAMGAIRDQQIRQSQAAGAILAAVVADQGTHPRPLDEITQIATIQATGAAAITN